MVVLFVALIIPTSAFAAALSVSSAVAVSVVI
jgi:hypothetical protein